LRKYGGINVKRRCTRDRPVSGADGA
jgi:hypothetical protein